MNLSPQRFLASPSETIPGLYDFVKDDMITAPAIISSNIKEDIIAQRRNRRREFSIAKPFSCR